MLLKLLEDKNGEVQNLAVKWCVLGYIFVIYLCITINVLLSDNYCIVCMCLSLTQ